MKSAIGCWNKLLKYILEYLLSLEKSNYIFIIDKPPVTATCKMALIL